MGGASTNDRVEGKEKRSIRISLLHLHTLHDPTSMYVLHL